MAESAFDPTAHDAELARLLERVVVLSGSDELSAPEDFLTRAEVLEQELDQVIRFRSSAALERNLLSFAQHRFKLVDEGREYAEVGHELLVLAIVLGRHAHAGVPALKHAVRELANVIGEENVVPIFGKLLKRLQAIARSEKDEELFGWVRAVAHALPGDDTPASGG
jgi:hypothetical protein